MGAALLSTPHCSALNPKPFTPPASTILPCQALGGVEGILEHTMFKP